MIPRLLSEKIRSLKDKFPVISLTGPRQSGKTTLLKSIYSELPYVTLEDPDNRQFATEDPRGFIANFSEGAFIDEAQYVPELFSFIQTAVDSKKVHFALSGSQNFLLSEKISQSLAGRTAILKLLPFSGIELANAGRPYISVDNALFTGGYPRVHDKQIFPPDFYPSYINTYLERDVRQLLNIENLHSFGRFLKLCAGRTGQLLNIASLASDAGISPNTAKSWLSILEASFVIFFLQPHHVNFNKRLVKSPKLYFEDTGIACSLLQIENESQLQSHYLRGGLFENFVINEMRKRKLNEGKIPALYFWQNKQGKEIDLIVEESGKLLPFEIKSSETKNPSLLSNLSYWQNLSGQPAEDLSVVYAGDMDFSTLQGNFVSWKSLFNGFFDKF